MYWSCCEGLSLQYTLFSTMFMRISGGTTSSQQWSSGTLNVRCSWLTEAELNSASRGLSGVVRRVLWWRRPCISDPLSFSTHATKVVTLLPSLTDMTGPTHPHPHTTYNDTHTQPLFPTAWLYWWSHADTKKQPHTPCFFHRALVINVDDVLVDWVTGYAWRSTIFNIIRPMENQ